MRKQIFIINWLLMSVAAMAQPKPSAGVTIMPGAGQLNLYLPLLKNKTVALFANQTSMVGQKHLVDILLENKIAVKKIFSPEHGFRGNADAGEQVENSIDHATRLPVISLYGNHNKPTADELKDVDIMLFDIQDVGVRFYTYINSMQYYLEAAIENDKPMLLLDRPNPNGFYVDGPILQPAFTSGVGVQPVPIVYGMTIGEYAGMLLGEKMLNEKAKQILLKQSPNYKAQIVGTSLPQGFTLQIVPCKNYDHTMTYNLPVKPSPNLPNLQSILLYPSICFFEGTELSLGRGTDKPFQQFGHPSLPDTLYSFTPASLPGAKNPPLLGKTCYGYDLSKDASVITKPARKINLQYLLKAYQLFAQKDSFFLRPKKGNPATSDYFFNKLAGNEEFMWQIMNGKTETEIRQSWEPGITAFRKIRKKYLLYGDFVQ